MDVVRLEQDEGQQLRVDCVAPGSAAGAGSAERDGRSVGVVGQVVKLDVGQSKDDAVVAVHGLHIDAEPHAHPGRDTERPGGMNRCAEG